MALRLSLLSLRDTVFVAPWVSSVDCCSPSSMIFVGGFDDRSFLLVTLDATGEDVVDEAAEALLLLDPPINRRDILLARDTIMLIDSDKPN